MNLPWKSRMLLFGGLSAMFLLISPESRAMPQEGGRQSESETSLMRPCSARLAGSRRPSKNKTKKPVAGANQANIACLEVKDSALNIQEFFQSYVRAQAWHFAEEKIVADGWMFVRHLNKDELLQFAGEGRFTGRVNWTAGKALVLVGTRELDDGFTRVEVAARMQGFGQSVDRFAPAKDSWDLDSTGLLEKTLIAALEAHCKSLHSSPAA